MMIVKLEFPGETISYFLKINFKKGLQKEFAHALCLKEGKIYPGGKPHFGNRNSVELAEPVCEKGKFIGDIHSHSEPHFDSKAPFNKGLTNIDFFHLIQDGLTDKINFPYIACVISPTVDNKNCLRGIRIDCEQYDKFTEKDIKKMKTNVMGDDIPKKFGNREITFFKECELPKGSFCWYLILANLKNQMKEYGFMKQDGIFIRCKYDRKKIRCWKPDKNILNF